MYSLKTPDLPDAGLGMRFILLAITMRADFTRLPYLNIAISPQRWLKSTTTLLNLKTGNSVLNGSVSARYSARSVLGSRRGTIPGKEVNYT